MTNTVNLMILLCDKTIMEYEAEKLLCNFAVAEIRRGFLRFQPYFYDEYSEPYDITM